jgi:hypothetical protein
MDDESNIPFSARGPDAAGAPVLPYGVAPRRRRAYVLLFVAIASVAYFAGPPLWQHWARWHADRTVLSGRVDADIVVADYRKHWTKSAQGSGGGGRHPKAKPLIRLGRSAILRRGNLLFAHERTIGGRRMLVAVVLAVQSLPDGVAGPAIMLDATAALVGQPFPPATTHVVRLGPPQEAGEAAIHFLAGQPDPADPAAFLIPMYVQDAPGHLRGHVAADGSVSFDLTALPKPPLGAFDPRPEGNSGTHRIRSTRPPPEMPASKSGS